MEIKINSNSFFVFDLDDTLYPEIDFLRSGYKTISKKLAPAIGVDIYPDMWECYRNAGNVFQWIANEFGDRVPGLSVASLLHEYREHLPDIALDSDAAFLLKQLAGMSVPAGLITDGRSITQRNKLRALQLENYFADVVISEEFGSGKPDERNFRYFSSKYPGREFFYLGDNTDKDFAVPARLGWFTICIKDRGTHIHRQTFGPEPYPACVISSFDQLQLIA
jgi:putative hydrolase of the HAD superfamily